MKISSTPLDPSRFATLHLFASENETKNNNNTTQTENADIDSAKKDGFNAPVINGVTVKPVLGKKRDKVEFKVNLHQARVMNQTQESVKTGDWQPDFS